MEAGHLAGAAVATACQSPVTCRLCTTLLQPSHSFQWPPAPAVVGIEAATACARDMEAHVGRATDGEGLAPMPMLLGVIIIIINPCKPYLTASAPRLTHWGGGK
jgi:hypothetical protein